jgi:nicotinamide riboside transporter PnuC
MKPIQNRNNRYARWLRSWWGRSLFGAFIGALLVAFSGIENPMAFLIGIVAGALVLFVLGRLE